jgi:LysM repeat protein
VSGMSERDEPSAAEPVYRCPVCDSVVAVDAKRCLMCGAVQPERPLPAALPPEPEPEMIEETAVPAAEVLAEIPAETPEPELPDITFVHVAEPVPPPAPVPDVFQAVMREKQSSAVTWLTAVFAVIIFILGILVVQYRDPNMAFAFTVTETPVPPSPTATPTWTPFPSDTPRLTATPAETPVPTETIAPEPPRQHTISVGDTLFGLALQYRISLDSILETNEMTQNSSIIAGQTVLIPWPTPTPPLAPVGMEVNGELVIADPTDCRRYEVVAGDSLNAIAARADLDYDLFLLVNRLTSESVIQPGDTICLPVIVYGATLQPTAGPSPTPSLTPQPPGPHLLYPAPDSVVEPPDGVLTLQWAAVKDLAADEWYMVEVTDMTEVNAAPWRGFTRDNAFRVPSTWRPPVPEMHQMRWRVSIVKVTDFRADGLPLYSYGGRSSADRYFMWEGAVPTPTPTATPLPTITPTVQN